MRECDRQTDRQRKGVGYEKYKRERKKEHERGWNSDLILWNEGILLDKKEKESERER